MTGRRKLFVTLAALALGAGLAYAGRLDAQAVALLVGLAGVYGAANVMSKGKRP